MSSFYNVTKITENPDRKPEKRKYPLQVNMSNYCILRIKGTVQRKLTGVVSYINQEIFQSYWTADILFLKLKETYSLNRKKRFQQLKPKYVTVSGKPIQIHKWKISHTSRWKPVLWFVAAIDFSLLTDSGNWLTATNSFELQREAYSRCRHNSGKPISAISWLAYRYQIFAADAPLNWINHIYWLKPLEPVFCYLESKFL